jgi:hypothetical protein
VVCRSGWQYVGIVEAKIGEVVARRRLGYGKPYGTPEVMP